MRKRILVIDDEKLIVKSTCILLRHQGYETVEAFSGEGGLAAARASQPDLILLDLVMPGMDGWQVLAHLQAETALAVIPVLIFTAKEYSNPNTVGSIRGARGHIRKPFEPEDLELAIRQMGLAGE